MINLLDLHIEHKLVFQLLLLQKHVFYAWKIEGNQEIHRKINLLCEDYTNLILIP